MLFKMTAAREVSVIAVYIRSVNTMYCSISAAHVLMLWFPIWGLGLEGAEGA